MKKEKIKFILLSLALVFSLSVRSIPEEMASSQEGKVELGRSASIGNLVSNLIHSLPEWLKIRHRAKKIVETLPEFPEIPPPPENKEIFQWIKELASFTHRRPGTPQGIYAEEHLVKQMKELGLENITKESIPIKVWSATKWSLEIKTKQGSVNFPCFYVVNTGFTEEDGIVAPLVYVKEGRPKDFKELDVKDKIVVADVPFISLPYGAMLKILPAYYLSDPNKSINFNLKVPLIFVRKNFLGHSSLENHPENDVYWNAFERGAKAIVLVLKDQPTNSNTHYGPYDGIMKPLPALWVGKYDGEKLREYAKQGLYARLKILGEIKDGETHNIFGILPGASQKLIIIHSHHDAPFQGATEDGAGIAQVLAQAKIWSKLKKEQRPKSLLFLFTAGHFYGSIGSITFAKMHKNDLLKNTDLVITLEHIASKEARENETREYSFTGELELSGIFTENQDYVVASVMKMLKKKPLPRVASIPLNFFGPSPPSDAAGFVLEKDLNVPVISWISGPAYLLCEEDTLDKVELDHLDDFSSAISYLIGTMMMLDSEKLK